MHIALVKEISANTSALFDSNYIVFWKNQNFRDSNKSCGSWDLRKWRRDE